MFLHLAEEILVHLQVASIFGSKRCILHNIFLHTGMWSMYVYVSQWKAHYNCHPFTTPTTYHLKNHWIGLPTSPWAAGHHSDPPVEVERLGRGTHFRPSWDGKPVICSQVKWHPLIQDQKGHFEWSGDQFYLNLNRLSFCAMHKPSQFGCCCILQLISVNMLWSMLGIWPYNLSRPLALHTSEEHRLE